MLKLLYTLLTSPLGLPVEPLWEYIILLGVGVIVHKIAWRTSPGGKFGALIYWGAKFLAFVAIWAVLYAVFAYWLWFVIGAGVLIVASIAFAIWKRRQKPTPRVID